MDVNVFLLGLLLVVILPLAEGGLFALLLREVYIRHPLPLNGIIVPEWWKSPPPTTESAQSAESVEFQETPVEFVEPVPAEMTDTVTSPDIPPAEVPPSAGFSVFDQAANIPKGLPVNDVLAAMTSDTMEDVPPELERIIEALATPEHARPIIDTLDRDDLQALADALPGQKIDFSQELDKDSYVSEPISSTAKEVLGDNFDFQALEQQLKELAADRQQTAENSEQPLPAPLVDAAAYSAETMLDVQEDDTSGTVQVSSPFMLNVTPQFASDFAMPQTVFPTFSNDLLQEPSSTAESMEGNIAKYCFSEESRPMFTRKTKKQQTANSKQQ